MSSTIQSLANRATAIKRHHGANSTAYTEAKREHAAAAIREAIERNLAEAPALTDEQFGTLAALLRGGAK